MLCRDHNPAKTQRKYGSQPRGIKRQPILQGKGTSKGPKVCMCWACFGGGLVYLLVERDEQRGGDGSDRKWGRKRIVWLLALMETGLHSNLYGSHRLTFFFRRKKILIMSSPFLG